MLVGWAWLQSVSPNKCPPGLTERKEGWVGNLSSDSNIVGNSESMQGKSPVGFVFAVSTKDLSS